MEKIIFKSGENIVIPLGDDFSVNLIWCQPGRFNISINSSKTAYETYNYSVEFTEGFWMSETLMTEQVWFFFFNEYHDKYLSHSEEDFDYPLATMSYKEVTKLLNQFRELPQLKIENVFIGLPNFMEWEYVARAGTQEGYFFGTDEQKFAEYAWYRGNNDNTGGVKIKAKKPNPWGFYDLFGYVSEYCYDVDFENGTNNLLVNPKSQTEIDVSLPIKGGNYDSKFGEFLTDKITYSNVKNHFNDEIGMRLLVKYL